MIQIPRSLAWQFRAVLRRSLRDQGSRGAWPAILCHTGMDGLHLHAQCGDVGIGFTIPSKRPAESIAFRSDVLAQLEGSSEDMVTLEQTDAGQGRARWTERGIPREVPLEIVPPESVPGLPKLPSAWSALPASFLQALDEAAQSTAKESVRFALSRIQLRGQAGELIGTDGRQLLVQAGFSLPWKDNVLVPCVRAFGLRELASEGTVEVGRVEQQVFVRVGPWTFVLNIDSTSRFPDVQAVMPRPAAITSRLRIDAADAGFLAEALPRIPGQDDEHSPVTLELDGKAVVRARSQGNGMTTELELPRSVVEGKPVRLCLDRMFLRRALRLGCLELAIAQPDNPVLAVNELRRYVFMPLAKDMALPPSKDAIRLAPAPLDVPIPKFTHPRRTTMPAPHANGPSANGRSDANTDPVDRRLGLEDLLTEAEAVRSQLQEASGRLARLIAGLKQYRRQSRAVEAAVQSLRGLKLEG